jgi:hypothetical protein
LGQNETVIKKNEVTVAKPDKPTMILIPRGATEEELQRACDILNGKLPPTAPVRNPTGMPAHRDTAIISPETRGE